MKYKVQEMIKMFLGGNHEKFTRDVKKSQEEAQIKFRLLS